MRLPEQARPALTHTHPHHARTLAHQPFRCTHTLPEARALHTPCRIAPPPPPLSAACAASPPTPLQLVQRSFVQKVFFLNEETARHWFADSFSDNMFTRCLKIASGGMKREQWRGEEREGVYVSRRCGAGGGRERVKAIEIERARERGGQRTLVLLDWRWTGADEERKGMSGRGERGRASERERQQTMMA